MDAPEPFDVVAAYREAFAEIAPRRLMRFWDDTFVQWYLDQLGDA